MKIENLKMLLKSREARSFFWEYAKLTIMHFFSKPILYVKAFFFVCRIYKNYPDRWERYVKFKEIENEGKIKEEKVRKGTLYAKFVGATTRFTILLITHCSYIKDDSITEQAYQKLVEDFIESQEDYRKSSVELRRFGVAIPEKLDRLIFETTVNRFNDYEKCQEFIDEVNHLRDSVKIVD